MQNDYLVYKHTNIVNGKIYIGITNDCKRRWRNGGIEYKPKEGRKSAFWNAIKKYGWRSFKHEILCDGLSFSEACAKEKELIAKYHSTDKNIGYNIASGGNGGRIYDVHPKGMLGKHQSEYEKATHRAMLLDHRKNPMTNGVVVWGANHKHPRGMLGKHQSLHHKEVMAKQTGTKNPHHKGLRIIFPNGNEEIWPTTKNFVTAVGFYKVYKLVKTHEPYFVDLNNIKKRDRAKCRKYMGCVFTH